MTISHRERRWLTACGMLAPLFSTCSKAQYFSVVIMPNGRVAGVGYNGSPPGMGHCVDGFCPRSRQNSPSGSVYDNCIAQHAEANALLWSDPAQRVGGTLIVNGPPCYGCAKQIASSGIARVVCNTRSEYKDWESSKTLLQAAGIDVVEVLDE